MRPREESIEAAHRLYKLALNRNFTRGRRTNQVWGRVGCARMAVRLLAAGAEGAEGQAVSAHWLACSVEWGLPAVPA